MYKLGSEKDIQRGQLHMWGYDVLKLWLVKDLAVKKYTKDCYKILGFCKDENNVGHGWCTVFCGSLKEARATMKKFV